MQYKPVTPKDIAQYIKKKKLNVEGDREYQLRIISKAINYVLIDGLDSIMLESPTGSGKTVMGQIVVQYLHDVGYSKSQSWVAMRRELLLQAKKHSEKINADYNMHYVSMFNKKPPITDIVVVDECQHDATESSTSQHIYVKPKLTIGLSATPERSDSAKLFFKRTIRDANTRVLIKAGYLSKFNHYMIENWDPETVAMTYLNEVERWGQSIVFFRTMDECEMFRDLLEVAGVNVEIVTQDSDREEQIQAFERGEVQVLVNMMILTEGFDCNTVHTAFVRDSSKNPTKQMAGRALRLNDGAIKNIVQSVKTSYTFLKVAEAENKHIFKNGEWEHIKENTQVEAMHKSAISAIIETIKEPEELSERLQRAYKKIGWGIKKGRRKRSESFDQGQED